MYQSVDDLDEIENDDALERAEARAAVWKVVIAAIVVLTLVVLFAPGLRKSPTTAPDPMRAEQASYHMAISEPSTALRRARLKDFATTYRQSDRLPAVSAQLAVLDLYEARAWAKVVDASYDPALDRLEKLSVIETYEREWSRAYLGGREAELSALRQAIESQAELPSRKMKDEPSPIPKTVPGQVMAGGPRPVVTPPPPTPRPVTPPPPAPTVAVAAFEPEIIRNPKPKYPPRAQRAEVEALVILSLSVDTRGRVALAELRSVDAERYERNFVNAAKRAARRTRYKPHVVNGEAQPVSGIIKRYRFKIGD